RFANSNVRTRVSKDEDVRLSSPSCFETHRSAFGLWRRLRSRRATTLLSMRARGAAHFGQTKPRIIWPSVVLARGTPRQQKRVYARLRRATRRGDPVAGTHDHRRWLWVPALPSLGRDDDGLVRAKHQPAAVRNDRRRNLIVSGCYLQ